MVHPKKTSSVLDTISLLDVIVFHGTVVESTVDWFWLGGVIWKFIVTIAVSGLPVVSVMLDRIRWRSRVMKSLQHSHFRIPVTVRKERIHNAIIRYPIKIR